MSAKFFLCLIIPSTSALGGQLVVSCILGAVHSSEVSGRSQM